MFLQVSVDTAGGGGGSNWYQVPSRGVPQSQVVGGGPWSQVRGQGTTVPSREGSTPVPGDGYLSQAGEYLSPLVWGTCPRTGLGYPLARTELHPGLGLPPPLDMFTLGQVMPRVVYLLWFPAGLSL